MDKKISEARYALLKSLDDLGYEIEGSAPSKDLINILLEYVNFEDKSTIIIPHQEIDPTGLVTGNSYIIYSKK